MVRRTSSALGGFALDRRALLSLWIPLFLLVAGTARIAVTWRTFTQTYDEPGHLSAGIEWWQEKKYTVDPHHPPLGRILIGALPFASGLRLQAGETALEQGNHILGSGPEYMNRLALARAGTLPFFLLFSISLWRWSNLHWGPEVGLATLFLATQLPPVLGHGGLATTDVGGVATLAFALWRLDIWLLLGGWRNVALLGVAAGLALSTKFTNFLLLPLLGLILWIIRDAWPRQAVPGIALAALLALSILAATYRFPLDNYGRAQSETFFLKAPFVPLMQGIKNVQFQSRHGHLSYLLGETYTHGNWLFFPIALGVKTPFPLLTAFAIALGRKAVHWTLGLFLTVLIILLPTQINLGIRHGLALYIGLCLGGGYGLHFLWTARPRLAILLALWFTLGIGIKHPDYLSWFNEAAMGAPERILADSDLDWGQDLHRTVEAMNRRKIKECKLAYFGTADWRRLFPGRFQEFRWSEPPSPGCYAISLRTLSHDMAGLRMLGMPEALGWAKDKPATERVGGSMRLYVDSDGRNQ